jgi:hypothetical protein
MSRLLSHPVLAPHRRPALDAGLGFFFLRKRERPVRWSLWLRGFVREFLRGGAARQAGLGGWLWRGE